MLQLVENINKYLKEGLSYNQIKANRQKIYDKLANLDLNSLSSTAIAETCKLFDEIYFDYNIKKAIEQRNFNLKFKPSKNLTKTAGKISFNADKTNFKFVISSYIFDNLKVDNNNKKKINGLICWDKLSCYIILFEHEFIHLVILISGMWRKQTAHGPLFKKLIYNLFGQTEYKHSLLLKGDADILEKNKKILKQKLKIGQFVQFKYENKIVEAKILKINGKTLRVELNDGKILIVHYEFLL